MFFWVRSRTGGGKRTRNSTRHPAGSTVGATPSSGARLMTLSTNSKSVGRHTLKMMVYLPPGYRKTPSTRSLSVARHAPAITKGAGRAKGSQCYRQSLCRQETRPHDRGHAETCPVADFGRGPCGTIMMRRCDKNVSPREKSSFRCSPLQGPRYRQACRRPQSSDAGPAHRRWPRARTRRLCQRL